MAQLNIDDNGNWEIIIRWSEDDIMQYADDHGIELNPDEVYQIMRLIFMSIDAEIGINWEVVKSAINSIKGESL